MSRRPPPGWNLEGEPREWQRQALAKWRRRGSTGIAHVVTGAGKTYFAQMCIVDWFKRQPQGRVIIVVPTLALLDQWYVDLEDGLRASPGDIAIYSGEQRSVAPARINLIVLNTARTVAPSMSNGAATFLIVDECHRAAAPANALALRGDHHATLGLSATPERQYDDGLKAILEPALGPIIFTYGYNAARADRVISEFVLINVSVSLSSEEQTEYERLTRRVGFAVRRYKDGTDDGSGLRIALRKRASVSANAAIRIPVAVALADRHRGTRTVIFHESIQAAESIHRVLLAQDHNVTLYHSRIPPAVRRDNLRLFRRGAFSVLVSCRALDEGVNVPETEIGIIASSTASDRQRIQRLGRVLRPAARKDTATVYTLFATETEERRLREEAETLIAAREIRWQRAGSRGPTVS